MAGIESVFDLAISIPHQLIEDGGGMLTGADEHVALDLVMKAKKALVDSGLLFKDLNELGHHVTNCARFHTWLTF